MPDTPIAPLVPDTVARRRDAVRDAVASVRIEGGRVDDVALQVLGRWAEGTLSDETMMAEILKPYAGRR